MTSIALLVLFMFPAFTVSGQITRNILIAICLICCHPKVSKKLCEPAILLFTWFIWAVFCSYQSDNFQMSLFGYHKRFEGINTWILALAFGWLFWRTSSLTMLFSNLLLIIFICLSMMIFKPDIYGQIMFGHIAIAAFVTVACSMLMAGRPAFILLTLPFIYLTQNRSIILGATLACVCYFVLNNKAVTKKHFMIGSAFLILVTLLAWPKLKGIKPFEMGNGMRTRTAVKAIEFATLKPLTGYGLDTQSTLFGTDDGEFKIIERPDSSIIKIPYVIDRCHNFFLDILVQTGVIGLILWLFILTRIVYRTFLHPSEVNRACLYGVFSFIGFGLFNPQGCPALFLACVCIIGIENKNHESN